MYVPHFCGPGSGFGNWIVGFVSTTRTAACEQPYSGMMSPGWMNANSTCPPFVRTRVDVSSSRRSCAAWYSELYMRLMLSAVICVYA